MKRKYKVAAVAIAALVLAGTALAYFLGTGTGTANAKSGTSPVTVGVSVDSSNAQALYPGDPAANVPVTVSYLSHPARISAVHLTIGTITGNPGTCLPSWFKLTDPSTGFGSGTNVTNGTPLVVNGSVQYDPAFDNVDESGCSGATIPITATAS
jgi:hypothetical protein